MVSFMIEKCFSRWISKSVMFDQKIKNLCDNAAIMIESKRTINKSNINMNGTDYIGDTGYLYDLTNLRTY